MRRRPSVTRPVSRRRCQRYGPRKLRPLSPPSPRACSPRKPVSLSCDTRSLSRRGCCAASVSQPSCDSSPRLSPSRLLDADGARGEGARAGRPPQGGRSAAHDRREQEVEGTSCGTSKRSAATKDARQDSPSTRLQTLSPARPSPEQLRPAAVQLLHASPPTRPATPAARLQSRHPRHHPGQAQRRAASLCRAPRRSLRARE